MNNLLPVGTKIIFLHEIVEPANGDHPEFLLANSGQKGRVVGYHDIGDMPYSVKAFEDAGTFAVKADEIRKDKT